MVTSLVYTVVRIRMRGGVPDVCPCNHAIVYACRRRESGLGMKPIAWDNHRGEVDSAGDMGKSEPLHRERHKQEAGQ